MTLLRSYEDRDDWPEYRTFMIRDCGPALSLGRASLPFNEHADLVETRMVTGGVLSLTYVTSASGRDPLGRR